MTATCDNEMEVFFDGVKQTAPESELNDWTKSSTFPISADTQVVGIKCVDLHVVGGILASFSTGEVTDGSWQCSTEASSGWASPGFVPSSAWQQATVIGNNGVQPWGKRPGISDSAEWIWTPEWSGGHTLVYCRKELHPRECSSVNLKPSGFGYSLIALTLESNS